MSYKYINNIRELEDGRKIIGVDFNPKKTCNFNCIYCGLGQTTRMINKREQFFPVEEITEEIKEFYQNKWIPTTTLLTGSGEPTLYSKLGELAKNVKDIDENHSLKMVTNGSFLGNEEVREEVSHFDIINLNLDSVIEEEFRRIGQMHKDVKLRNIIEGAEKLSEEFSGTLNVATKFIRGINDNVNSLKLLKQAYEKINPDNIIFIFSKPNDAPEDYDGVNPEFGQNIKDVMGDLSNNLIYTFDRKNS
jgi:wyosine [tRNA(Phe)-imidazoG37] synthetase (radical SAM superfamily)